MRKSKKILLILSVLFVLVGAMIFTVGIASLNFDFTKLSTEKAEAVTYEILENFDNIAVNVNTADVRFEPAEDGKGKVVCRETDKVKHNAYVNDGTLTVDRVDTRKWYSYIGVNFVDMEITVYLPKREYSLLSVETNTGDITLSGDVTFENVKAVTDTGDISVAMSEFGHFELSTDTGDVTLTDVSADEIEIEADTGSIEIKSAEAKGKVVIETDTGDVSVTDLACQSFETESDTGDILLSRVCSADSLTVNTSTGDVIFDHADASSIFVETNTGDVEGTLDTEKVFITETSTGKVNVPKSITGGRCEIVTSTGDIEIEIE